MVIVRLARGVSSHFRSRITDWCLAGALIITCVGLTIPDQNDVAMGVLRFMDRVAPVEAWGHAGVAVGFLRLVALGINGTFPAFAAYTALFRGAASGLSTVLWVNILIGYATWSPLPLSTGVWLSVLVLELYNVYLGAIESRSVWKR